VKQNEFILLVSVTIYEGDKVLIIKESKAIANKWNFPSGRIEYGEDIFILLIEIR
jgi:8-oxo-dGTP diphosphatase